MAASRLLDDSSELALPARRLSTGFIEALFAFAILAPLLFVPQLRALAPASSFAFTVLYGATRPPAVRRALLSRWPLLLIPAYAFLSAAWSAYPAVTLKHAAELLLTVGGGLLLSASVAPAGVLAGGWAAFALFMLVSLAFGRSVGVGALADGSAAGSAFAGLNGVKNLFGMMGALSVLTSLFMIMRATERRVWLVLLGALGLLLIEIYLTFIARSAGALIALAIGAAVMLAFGVLTLVKRTASRLVVAGLLLLLAATAGVALYAVADNAAEATLSLFGKDPTLTGRSYLWYRAHDYIAEQPWLGRGFDAFWVQGNGDAEGLWQFGKVAEQAGFNFHNTLIEFLIHFGWVGTVLTLTIYGYALAKLINRAFREANAVAAFYLGLLAFQLARSPVESLMPSAVDFATVLIFAALGYGFARPRYELVLERRLAGRPAHRLHRPGLQLARRADY